MLIFGPSYKGILSLEIDTKFFHTYSLIFLLFNSAFSGFLFTTFPRFNQYAIVAKNYYLTTFFIFLVGNLLFYMGVFFNYILVIVAISILILSDILVAYKLNSIYENSKVQNKRDSYWILSAKYFGVLGNILFLIVLLKEYFVYKIDFLPIAINFSFYLYLVLLVFSVAQRMVPFFSNSFVEISNKFLKIVFILLILKTALVITDKKATQMVVDIFLGVLLIVEFHKWKLPIFNSPAILWVLLLALFWLPASLIISGFLLASDLFLHISFNYLNTHLLAIGFLTTMLVGFATRVLLGHSGLAIYANRSTIAIFIAIEIVLVLRALYSVDLAYGFNISYLFESVYILWILIFSLWGAKFIKLFFKKLN